MLLCLCKECFPLIHALLFAWLFQCTVIYYSCYYPKTIWVMTSALFDGTILGKSSVDEEYMQHQVAAGAAYCPQMLSSRIKYPYTLHWPTCSCGMVWNPQGMIFAGNSLWFHRDSLWSISLFGNFFCIGSARIPQTFHRDCLGILQGFLVESPKKAEKTSLFSIVLLITFLLDMLLMFLIYINIAHIVALHFW